MCDHGASLLRPSPGLRALRLPAYWAHCEEHVLGDVAAAREVWEGAVKGGVGRYPEVWEAYIGMERAARRIKEARVLYKRCYSRRFEEDGQVRLCHAWLRFEREEGSADDYLQATLKVEPYLEESAAAAAAAADQAAAAAAKAAAQKAKNLSKEELKAMRQAKDPNFKKENKAKSSEKAAKGNKEVKALLGGSDADKENVLCFTGGKRARQDETGAETMSIEDADTAATASKRVRTHEPEPAAAEAATSHAKEAAQEKAAAAQHDGDEDMADHGEGEARHAGGEGEQGAAAGPGPSARGPAGSRPLYTDQMTVFLKGLRMGLKDEELETFLREHVPEGIKEIRVMRDHATGACRGFAYVECSTREALEKAVALNGTTFQGRALFIAESKPPGPGSGAPMGRGPGGRFQGGRGRFSGPPGGRGGFASRGRGRGWGGADADESKPPTALVPRSVQLAQDGGAESKGQPMSNDDFRKMLFGGKK
ncbi:hypothetical protein GPECTOR_7g1165 [Gonium pectorale]|uniref:RRM domain-containing protein n=1 Tax=Gonium pectorale TaxID=33097 RepID=A0A150GTX5_GONPE|nr:hypothetical protein GPECTOR_7g1165 [Gonium pectorale]|eukprot:KXZ53271.1 hypothetical protein GPECTOR_7g1165 [Gonium pectorale]